MTKLVTPTSVFVPHQWIGKTYIKRFDLPRFTEPAEIISYLADHPELSNQLLEWIELSDAESIREYISGVGARERPTKPN